MKLCTCNKCENVWEDINPQIGAKDYADNPYIDPLIKLYSDTSNPETGYWGCPVCCTDSYLDDCVEEFTPENAETDEQPLTWADFIIAAKGNKQYADILWSRRDWAYPETMVQDDLQNGEIEQVGNTYRMIYP